MENSLIKFIFNAPFKKCKFTKTFYPATFMLRLIEGEDCMNNRVFIPDCMYSRVPKYILFSLKREIMYFVITKY